MKTPIRVAVTGPCGQIGYAMLFRIASGGLFGPDQPVHLRMMDINTPEAQAKLKGIMMELADCAFPTLAEMTACTDEKSLFEEAESVFLIGSRPQIAGSTKRSDLLKGNAEIFRTQGRALDEVAARHVRVCMVANPCNTLAYIAMKNAPSLAPECFSALMRLDQNRSLARVAEKLQVPVRELDNAIVWGNHSDTMYPDLRFVRHQGITLENAFDQAWLDQFVPGVIDRGWEIVRARGISSGASAGSAALDHMRDWFLGAGEKICTMAVPSDGSYGIPEGLMFGFPCHCSGDRQYRIIDDLPMTESVMQRLALARDELIAEAQAVESYLPKN